MALVLWCVSVSIALTLLARARAGGVDRADRWWLHPAQLAAVAERPLVPIRAPRCFWSPAVAAGVGVVWILGRIIYAQGYMSAPGKRAPGFLIQMLATAVLLFGAAGRLIYLATAGAAA